MNNINWRKLQMWYEHLIATYKNVYSLKFLPFAFTLFISNVLFGQTATFDIAIIQNGKRIPITSQELQLKKEAFVFEIVLKEVDQIYVHAAFSDSMFVKNSSLNIYNFENIPSMSMAESTFNEYKELIMQNKSWHCWFVSKDIDWNRFDKDQVFIKDNTITGYKTIEKFYNVSDENEENYLNIEAVNADLYLFFLTFDFYNNQDYSHNVLGDYHKLKISWID